MSRPKAAFQQRNAKAQIAVNPQVFERFVDRQNKFLPPKTQDLHLVNYFTATNLRTTEPKQNCRLGSTNNVLYQTIAIISTVCTDNALFDN